MFAATEGPLHDQNEDGDAPGAPEALLVEQLALATRQLRTREAEGRRTDEVRAVIRSLRKTLASIAEHGCVPDLESSEFSVKCPAPGIIELWHRGRKLPADVRAFREALESAGVQLQPGQVLLGDRQVARRLVEESLVALSLEEFRIREGKTVLLRALHGVSAPSAHLS